MVLVALAAAAVLVAAVWGWDCDDWVTLAIAGAGQVTGPPEAPVVELADGRLDAEVVPNRGTHLQVDTDEATVTVIGTAFSVDRARFATTVAVVHGTVEVACVGRDPVRVTGGESHRCLPATASGLLRRIVALGSSDSDWGPRGGGRGAPGARRGRGRPGRTARAPGPPARRCRRSGRDWGRRGVPRHRGVGAAVGDGGVRRV